MSTAILDCNRAITEVASFIKDSRCEDGLWRDFKTRAGESCDWVTGFTIYNSASSDFLRNMLEYASRSLLRRQYRNGGWSYNNEEVPPDCDSTAWVLLAESTVTVWKPSAILRGMAFISRHFQQEGFSTYNVDDGIERFIQANPTDADGWYAPRLCVSATACQALLLHGNSPENSMLQVALRSILGQQAESGLWSAYWWRGPEYSTAQAIRALAAAGQLSNNVWERASRGLLSQQNSDGGWGTDRRSTAFETAMALVSLLTRPDKNVLGAIDSGVEWLVDFQEDGRWPSEPILRIPNPAIDDFANETWQPDGLVTGALVRDQNGIFSAAASIGALETYRGIKEG